MKYALNFAAAMDVTNIGTKDLIERHFTLDRAMWGSDQAASVEPGGFRKLVKYVRVTEMSLGDGVKRVYDSEKPSMIKLRRYL